MVMALATVAGANAQIFKFGVKAGMNINKMHFSNDAAQKIFNPDNSCGWTAGIMGEFNVPVIGICVDASLMYARMNNGVDDKISELNSSIPGQDTYTEEKQVFGRNFLEIPIHLKYKLNLPVVASIVKPMIFTGPNFAFKLDKNLLKSMKTKTCQVAWDLGIGVELLNHLQVAGSYSFGINNIADFTLGTHTQEIKAKNSYWQITAAYLF